MRVSNVFQSSPTSKGGRYVRYRSISSIRDQLIVSILAHLERWALPRGQRKEQREGISYVRVSILAHLERWALHGSRNNRERDLIKSFNPRPPRKVGATPCPFLAKDCKLNLQVSILAHLERWALRCTDSGISWFQFAHLERWGYLPNLPCRRSLFQSSPTSKGGRYDGPVRSMNGSRCVPDVSILAHLERWALRLCILRHERVCAILSFQSSPTSKGGRYGMSPKRHLSCNAPSRVSILAHLERWALP